MQNRWMAWLLLAVAGLQFYLINQISDLTRAHETMDSNLRSQINQLGGRIDNLSIQVTAISRASEWVSSPRVSLEPEVGCMGARAVIDWTFKELPPGTPVRILYRKVGAATWQEVKAALPTGVLAYRAEVAIPGPVRTELLAEVIRQSRNGGSSTALGRAYRPESYEYRIVATVGSSERSSDTYQFDAGKLFEARFRARVTVLNDSRYQVHLLPLYKPEPEAACLQLAGATVRGFAGSSPAVVSQELTPTSAPEGLWTEFTSEKPLDRLEIVTRFQSGREEVQSIELGR